MQIIIGSASKALGISIPSSSVQVSRFSDGEINVEITSSLYNQEVFIVQSLSQPVNDNIMELLLLVDAVKRVGAKKITAVIPYYGYCRQDRVTKNSNMRSALSAKLVASLIEVAGVDKIIALDLHSNQIEGFFNIPVIHLSCLEMLANHIPSLKNLAIIAPDVGGIGRARIFAQILETKYNIKLKDKIVVVDKYREEAGVSQVINIIGEVTDKNCIIIDDIVDSGSTLCNAANALQIGRARSIVACITHGVLSGSAIEKIASSIALDRLIITNTISPKFAEIEKIEVVSIASILGNFIENS